MNGELKYLLTLTQNELYSLILKEAKGLPIEQKQGKYLIINYNPNSVLLCSHLDTINGSLGVPKQDIVEHEDTLSLNPESNMRCLGGDDRAGVCIMLALIKAVKDGKLDKTKYTFGFFYDEEIGGIGSSLYTSSKHFKGAKYSCYVGLDRKNTTCGRPEFATYGYDNQELNTLFLASGYKETWGSFTDASNIASVTKEACVNISIGYNMEHTKREYVYVPDMVETYRLLLLLPFSKEAYLSRPELSPVVCDYCGVHDVLYQDTLGMLICPDCMNFKENIWEL